MKGKKAVKKALAFLLAFCLSVPDLSGIAYAAQKDVREQEALEQALKEELSKDADKYPNGLFGFYRTQLTQEEGSPDGQILTVVRQGGCKGEASVSFKAVDISARYGSDYLLTVIESDHTKRVLDADENSRSLMEQYADNLQVEDENLPVAVTGSAIQANTENLAAVTGSAIAINTKIIAGEGKTTGMAAAKAAQTGKTPLQADWHELNQEEKAYGDVSTMMDSGEEAVENMIRNVEGVTCELTFADGEYKKEIIIDIIDDDLSESEEQVMFAIYDAAGADLGENKTAYLNIKDNEEKEDPVFSIGPKEITIERGTKLVEILVKRTAGFDQMSLVEVGTKAIDAKAGTDYVSKTETLVFAPGMTEKIFQVELLDSPSMEEVSFYVGLRSNSGKEEKEEAAKVRIKGTVQTAEGENEEAAVKNRALRATSEEQVAGPYYISISNAENAYSCRSLAEVDLRTAESVDIRWVCTDGSYTYKDGCDNKTSYSRQVILRIHGIEVYSNIADRMDWQTTTVKLEPYMKNQYARIEAAVATMNRNRNAGLYIESIKVKYPQYTYIINNEYGSQDKVVNPYNLYKEKTYTSSGSGGYTESKIPLKLGDALVNNSTNSVTVTKPSDALNFSFQYSNDKTSAGTQINGNTVSFKGYQLKEPNSANSWSNTLQANDLNIVNMLDHHRSYINNNTIIVRPVFEVKDTKVKFNNSESNKGAYKGFDNGTKQTVKSLDTMQVTAAPRSGFAVTGFSLNGSQKIDTGRADTVRFAASADCSLDIVYGDASITVQKDPKGWNTDKGDVIYYDTQNPEKSKSTVNTGKMVLDSIEMGKFYRFLGVAREGYENYYASWRDGTFDTNGDGVKSELEKEAFKEYREFTPVEGPVLEYRPTLPTSKIYVDFRMLSKHSSAALSALDGRVILQEKELFTGKVSEKGVNNVNISVAGTEGDVSKYYAGDRRHKAGDGYFYIEHKNLYAHGYYLVNATYPGSHGGNILASAVFNPDSFKEIKIKADEEIWTEGAGIYKVVNNQEGASVQPTQIMTGTKDSKVTYRLKIRARGVGSIDPRKAVLRFYDNTGKEYAGKAITKEISASANGNFTFDIVPFDLGLGAGTTMTLQFYDQNGKAYFENQTGIKVKESIGVLDFANSFEFGGMNTAIKLLGVINSAFRMGWNGDFDSESDNVAVVEENGVEKKIISVGFSTDDAFKRIDLKSVGKDAKNSAIAKKEYEKAKNDKNIKPSDLAKLKENSDKAEETLNKSMEKSSNPKKVTTTVAANVDYNVEFRFAMTFISDPEHNGDYYFDNMLLYAKIGGGIDVNVAFATPIGITINLGFGARGDGTATYVIEQRADTDKPQKYYLKTLTDSNNRIDIFNNDLNSNNRAFDAYGAFGVNPEISISAGVGVLGNLVRVTVGGSATFNMTFYTADTENTGSVTLAASIGVTVLGIGGNWTFASTNIPLFGPSTNSCMLNNLNYLYDSADRLKAVDRDYLKERTGWNTGNKRLRSIMESENGVSETTLREGTYQKSDTKMVRLNENGDYLALFLDDDMDTENQPKRTSLNSTAVHYSIYDHTTNLWNQPQLLEDDGTLDEGPEVFDLGDRGIIVAWSSADQIFTEEHSNVDMMNSVNIHAAFFDKTSKKFGPIAEVTKTTKQGSYSKYIGYDNVADLEPNITYDAASKKLLIYYTKNQYEASESGEIVGDVIHPVLSLMAYRTYTFASENGTDGTWENAYSEKDKKAIEENFNTLTGDDKPSFDDYYAEYTANWYGQSFLETAPSVFVDEQLDASGYWKDGKEPDIYPGYKVITENKPADGESGIVDDTTTVTGSAVKAQIEPKIVDSDAITYNQLGLFAYTVDYDQDLKTTDDRDIYLQYYDYETDRFTHPIMVTSNGVCDSDAKFLRVEDGKGHAATYLTWLSDGNIMGMNVSNAVKNCLKKKQTGDGQEYYIIDKSNSSGYEPAMVMVEGERADGQDNAESAIASFDVKTYDGYVYFLWTQNGFTLKEGVEKGSEEAADVLNQLIETQIYVARYDVKESRMTSPVKVTDEAGMNYDNIAFEVENDGNLKALATKSETHVVTLEEFNRGIREFNESANASEKMEEVTADAFHEYVERDTEYANLVALSVNPRSVMKVETAEFEDLTAGKENLLKIRLLNDGIDTMEGMKLEVKDDKGVSLLEESQLDVQSGKITYKSVDSITVDKLFGGERYETSGKLVLPETETEASYTVTLTDKEGNVILEKSYQEVIEHNLSIDNLLVEETEERNVFKMRATVVNAANRISEADMLQFGIQKEDSRFLAVGSVEVPKLKQGESITVERIYTVDSKELFTQAEGENGFLHSTADFAAAVDGKTQIQTIERAASGDQMDKINAIEEGVINNNKEIILKVDELSMAVANIKSSLEDAENEITGTEGLKVRWAAADPSILMTYESGYIKGLKKGKTTLHAYVMPKNSASIVTVDTSNSLHYGEETDNYRSLPDAAIKKYSIPVTVVGSGSHTPDPVNPDAEEDKEEKQNPVLKGDKITVGSSTYTVTASAEKTKQVEYSGPKSKTIKKVTIPSSIKIGKETYKVVSIGKNALKGCKELTMVKVGASVKTIKKAAFKDCTKLREVRLNTAIISIQTDAFRNCKSLKKIVFGTKNAPAIGKNAFRKIYKKAVFYVPDDSIKKYKIRLKAAIGFSKTMVIKEK